MLVSTKLGLIIDTKPDEPREEGNSHGVVDTDFGGRLNAETPPEPALRRALRWHKTSAHFSTVSGSEWGFVVLLPRVVCSGL